jgi:hypothetical protein
LQYARVTGQSNPPKPRGCFFYGCLALAVAGLLCVAAIAAVYFWARSVLNTYTSTTPALLEKVEYPPAQMDALKGRLQTFKKALDDGKESVELVLTADDLNALISQEARLRGTLFVRIEDDRIKGEISMPLPNAGPFRLKGRYLNGAAVFRVALNGGVLDVRLNDVLVQNKPLPAVIFKELKSRNLAQDFQTDPRTAADIAKFESIQITNGAMRLRSSVPKQ